MESPRRVVPNQNDVPEADEDDDGVDCTADFLRSVSPGVRAMLERVGGEAADPEASETRYVSSQGGDRSKDSVKPNGPASQLRFNWDGRSLDFSRAPLRYQLLKALWDEGCGGPREERDTDEVMGVLWPDDPESEGKLKNLCFYIRKSFREAGMPLDVRRGGEKMWIEVLQV